MKKWIKAIKAAFEGIEEALAARWKTSLLRLPISFFHHAWHRAWLEGKGVWDVRKEAWKETLATRRHRLAERKRRKAHQPAAPPEPPVVSESSDINLDFVR